MHRIGPCILAMLLAVTSMELVAAPTEAIENADTPEAKGLAIAEEADARVTGFDNYTVDMEMILRNDSGQESIRELRTRTLEKEPGDWSMIIFDQPKDVEGTAFLTHSNPGGVDDQWLFLPALKRVKRISATNQSGHFMGSEFAYEDLSDEAVEKYEDYRLLGEETLGPLKTWKVERKPVNEYSGYTRQIVWIDQEEYRPLMIEYYNLRDELLKTLKITGYRLYLDDFWFADKMLMENHQTGSSTVLHWKDYQFRQDFNERDFDQNALKRAR